MTRKVIPPQYQDVECELGVLVRVPVWIDEIPSRVLMLERAEDLAPDSLPVYSVGQMARTFFGMSPDGLYKLLRGVSVEEWAACPMDLPSRPTTRGGRSSWTLAEVERVIHGLFLMGRIKYDRQAIALHLVAWTAKAYGVYV